MQLTQLEIKGFKSFGDKITINFNEGVTAIVGPNGCGKSNVIDAIRWVLGEQSTRMLRSEKMENIIFNGNKTRKPSNLAEVSLSFDNTKNILPTAFSSVTLTRKLYRNGESEYRLNDVQCRLKDITDLFLDTGIGSDSYSIIELKMIDEIIANKENSRRALFEEASGISKYKLRKKQTFSKLKDTEIDLSRVEDILYEIEKNLKTLESQAKKTERYYKLKEQYKELSISLASLRIVTFRETLEKLEEQDQKQALEKEGINTEIDKFEAKLQQQKLDTLTKEKNLSAQQKVTNEFISKIRNYETEKKLKNEQLRFLEDKQTRLLEDLNRDKNQLNHVLYNIKRLNEEHFQETETLANFKSKLENQKGEVDQLRLKQQENKETLDLITSQHNELQKQLYSLEKEIAILNIQLEALSQEGKRNLTDTQSREAELNGFNKVVTDLELTLSNNQNKLEELQSLDLELQQQIRKTTEFISAKKEELSKSSRKLDSKQNEYNLTKSMVDNLEGYPESIRFLKKNAAWAKEAVLFSDVLFCKEEFRIAIENYLEPVMNHYVVETNADAAQAINLLSDSGNGRANFFVLQSLTKSKINTKSFDQNVGLPALSVVEVESKYHILCEMLLHNVYITQTDEQENIDQPLPDEEIIILSSKGRFTKFRGGLSGGSVGLFEGKRIGRAKNLENLIKEIKNIENIITKTKVSIEQETTKLTLFQSSLRKQDIEAAQQAINLLNNDLISVKTKQEQYVAFIENSQTRKQDIEEKLTAITNQLLLSTPQLESLKNEKQIKTSQLVQHQHDYNGSADLLNQISTEYNQENIKYHQQQNKVSALEKDLEYRQSQHQNLDEKLKENGIELDKVKTNIQETLKHVGHSDDGIIAMYVEKEELEKGVKEIEQNYYASRGIITDIETQITALRRNKELLNVLFNEIKDKKNNLKLDLNALKERLSIEFSIDISDMLDQETSATSEPELKEKITRIKGQLDDFGAINPMAMEAYNEMNGRFSFIQAQKKDLLDAKASLLKTILEIDETAREKFMAAFTQVREHFIEVFRSLFNDEDSCDLVLTDPLNPIESDIEILAQPKGKRPLSINQLSGGEKTLTATALLFSLYLLKPAPFCIFDEVDAPLDDSNIDKFNNIIRKFSDKSQFIVVSHNKRTIASTDIIYGVTMVEQGVSKVVAVDLRASA